MSGRSEVNITEDEALRQIARAFKNEGNDWRYSVRRILQEFHGTSWRDGYGTGWRDKYDSTAEAVKEAVS